MKKLLFLPLLIIGCGCHPLSFWHPPTADPKDNIRLSSTSDFPKQDVKIDIDNNGVPHIYANDRLDASYGLGFMHARDRLFQLDSLRRAAKGNLGPLFGDKVLDVDRKLRLLVFQLKEQYEALEPADKVILEAYSAGVNAGAAHVGRSVQHAILGVDFEEFKPMDSISVARLQSWDLANDMREELVRARIKEALPENSPILASFFKSIPDGGIPIVSSIEQLGTRTEKKNILSLKPFSPEASAASMPNEFPALRRTERIPNDKFLREEVEDFIGMGKEGGASNAWVVSGEYTQSGAPMLANDPHLKHRAPGVFYLAHINVAGRNVVGASMAGLPAVVIGHSDVHAWGATAAFADNQDLVEIQVDPEDSNYYIVDGIRHEFGKVNHRFVTGSGENEFVREAWKTTLFGPVLPSAYGDDIPEGKTYALMWTGFVPGSINSALISGFWNLGQAEDLEQASVAVDQVTMGGLSVTLAFVDGTYAYRLGSPAIVRKGNEPNNMPRNGSTWSGGWEGFLMGKEKPEVQNPRQGYVIASNQRIVDDQHPSVSLVGDTAASPHRALRIDHLLREKLSGDSKISSDHFSSMQQDVHQPDAKAYSDLFASKCPEQVNGYRSDSVKALCERLIKFDGNYDANSKTALPYTLFYEHMRFLAFEHHLGGKLAEELGYRYLGDTVFENELDLWLANKGSSILDLVPDLLERTVARTLDTLHELAGANPEQWIWGRAHKLRHQGPLAKAPLIGGWFQTDELAQSGHKKCIRAEHGFPVKEGAAFRMIVELTNPPRAKMIMDTGNYGHPGHAHFEDLFPKWSAGEFIEIETNQVKTSEEAEGKLVLEGVFNDQ